MEEEEKPKKGRAFLRRWWLMSLIIIILGVGTGIYSIAREDTSPAEQIPASIRSSTSFPLYLAVNPPPGFTLNKLSFTTAPGVVIFSYSYDGSTKIAVTEQPRQSGVDPSQFKPTTTFNALGGIAYLANFEQRVTVAVINSKSFLLINADQGMTPDLMKQFILSLQKVQN